MPINRGIIMHINIDIYLIEVFVIFFQHSSCTDALTVAPKESGNQQESLVRFKRLAKVIPSLTEDGGIRAIGNTEGSKEQKGNTLAQIIVALNKAKPKTDEKLTQEVASAPKVLQVADKNDTVESLLQTKMTTETTTTTATTKTKTLIATETTLSALPTTTTSKTINVTRIDDEVNLTAEKNQPSRVSTNKPNGLNITTSQNIGKKIQNVMNISKRLRWTNVLMSDLTFPSGNVKWKWAFK